ncbi:hypothetical protein EDC04DRAFT_2939419 [Pisolithus marmoratus]|nr:hypothetical protein EDC04DRAFT_2939419 [Pisolithus marmoratus]
MFVNPGDNNNSGAQGGFGSTLEVPWNWQSACLQAFLVQPMASSSGQPHQGQQQLSSSATTGASQPQVPAMKPARSGSKGKGPAVSNQQQVSSLGDSSMEQPKNINWDIPHTEKLVQWLLTHPANCRILFSDKNLGDLLPLPVERPMGHNKEVQLIITEVVFGDDPVYKDMQLPQYAESNLLKESCTVQTIWGRDHTWPSEVCQSSLLCMHTEAVLSNFPWYDDLHSIWQGNPSFDPEPINSEPNKNHAEGFLAIIQNKTASMKNISSLRADTSVGSGGIVPGGGMVDNQGGEPEEGEIEEEMASPGMDEEHGEADFDDEMLQHWVDEQDNLGADEFHPDIDMDLMSMQGDQPIILSPVVTIPFPPCFKCLYNFLRQLFTKV